MEQYSITNLRFINSDGKEIGFIPEGILQMELGRIEIVIDEIMLSDQTIQLLKIWIDKKSVRFNIEAVRNGENILIENVITRSFTFESIKGEPVKLKNIKLISNKVNFLV